MRRGVGDGESSLLEEEEMSGGQPLGDGCVLLGYLAASVRRTTLPSCEAFGGDGVVRCCLGRGRGCDR
jgi:hypothetical protein